jgi:uncharacterized protein YjbI with pentapeptide repeats
MFKQATMFEQDLSSCNTSGVENMSFMFYGASLFNSDLFAWDVSQVSTTHAMFHEATMFDQDYLRGILFLRRGYEWNARSGVIVQL